MNFTKKAIISTFEELLNERPLNKITVKDIVGRCGINRNTFYYHFEGIPSLLDGVARLVALFDGADTQAFLRCADPQ